MSEFDLIVIGGGSAGLAVVRKAAAAGWNTALVESDHLGGTCINVGCIPSKTLIHSARVMHMVAEASKAGVITGQPQADWPAMVHRKDRLVGRIRAGNYRSVEENDRISFFAGEAVFKSPREIAVNDKIIASDKIVIAAGARPALPSINGLAQVDFLTSTSIMELKELPQSLLIIGGGVIGLEFAQLFNRLGVEVTILQRNKRLVPNIDPEIAAEIQKILEAASVRVINEAVVKEIKQDEPLIFAEAVSGGKTFTYHAAQLLIATGRTANSERLELFNAGIDTDDRGFITVDHAFRTNVNGIWAIGDITGGAMYTHRAWHDGMLLGRHLVDKSEINTRGRIIPYAIFTDPEIAGVGMNEEEALKEGYGIKVLRFRFGHHGRALAMDRLEGFIKLVSEEESGKLLGAQIIGPEAGELIHELILAITLGATIDTLKNMMHIHPTLAEAINSTAWSG